MTWRPCTAEQAAQCPLASGCVGQDTHHAYFPANRYTGKIEKKFRELPRNKLQLPRCLHQAIHASRYIPQMPSREDISEEIRNPDMCIESQDEIAIQLYIGTCILGREIEPPEDIV